MARAPFLMLVGDEESERTWIGRYKNEGIQRLAERSRRRHAQERVGYPIRQAILELHVQGEWIRGRRVSNSVWRTGCAPTTACRPHPRGVAGWLASWRRRIDVRSHAYADCFMPPIGTRKLYAR